MHPSRNFNLVKNEIRKNPTITAQEISDKLNLPLEKVENLILWVYAEKHRRQQ